MKNYVSKSFVDRIEINLANISKSKDDKFKLIGISYVTNTFTCDLCGHNPCVNAYKIKNLETKIDMTVGSECVKHFIGECDIDLADGLLKRIKSITRKMRKYMKKYIDNYKEMSIEEKRENTCKLFAKYQVKELLKEEGKIKRAILDKEEVMKILNYEA